MTSPVQRLIDIAGHAGAAPQRPPFFIVGAARSGTTLLRVLLDNHPAISVGPETNILSRWFWAVERSTTLAMYPYSLDDLLAAAGAGFELFHRRYMIEQGKQRWGDKTPKNRDVLPEILACWPDAQILHSVRDGRDVALSMRDRWGWSARAASREWANRVERVLNATRVLDDSQYLEVRYEELVANPTSVMGDVLKFLGEPWMDEVLVQEGRDRHGQQDVPEANRPVDASSAGRWRTDASLYERFWMRKNGSKMLTRLGYR